MAQEINPYAMSVLSAKQVPDKSVDVEEHVNKIKEFTNKFFKDDIESIFITNSSFSDGKSFFSLLINREYMHLAEKKKIKKNKPHKIFL